MIVSGDLKAFTFNLPGAGRTPSCAHSDKGNREWFGIRPRQEGDGFAFPSRRDNATVPTHPETTEFTAVQNVRGFDFNFVGLGSVPPDHTLCVAPTSKEDLANNYETISCCIFFVIIKS